MKHRTLPTTPQTARRMSRVKLKGGNAERLLGRTLWRSGIRYRRNLRGLPGSPDLALTKHQIAVFVDGEFWHGKDWAQRRERLQRNRDYWIEKIEENMARDRRDEARLRAMGWTVLRFWEKEVLKDVEGCASEVVQAIADART